MPTATISCNQPMQNNQNSSLCAFRRAMTTRSGRASNPAIRSLLKRLPDGPNSLRILPLRVGDGDVAGFLDNAIIPDVRHKTADETATLILDRLRLLSKRVFLARPGGSQEPSIQFTLQTVCGDLEICLVCRWSQVQVLPGALTARYSSDVCATLTF